MKKNTKSKINWWKIASIYFLLIFIFNILAQIFLAMSYKETGSTLVIHAIAVIIQVMIIGIFPYLYFKKSKLAPVLTIVYFVIIEGGFRLFEHIMNNNLTGILIILSISLSYIFIALKTQQARN